jgi:hypothetical protein
MVKDIPPQQTRIFEQGEIRMVMDIRSDIGADHIIDMLARSTALDTRLNDAKQRPISRGTRRSITRLNHG